MKILWIKANKILPVHSGGELRSFNILRQLATREEVIFFSYYEEPTDVEYEGKLQEQLPGAIAVSTGKGQASLVSRSVHYLWRLPEPVPYAVSRFGSSKVRERLKKCLAEQRPDVVVADFLDAAVNLPEHMDVPSVLFQHNVESEIWRRHASNEAIGPKKLVYGLEFSKMLRYEQRAVNRFDHVIAVSDNDKNLMSAWTAAERISVVPTGVDTEQFCPGSNSRQEKPLVIFVGAMDWEPNVDAAKYFCAEIWPLVVAKVPDARFRIVGRNPDRRVQALAGTSVEITGRVPSVVEHLHEAAVVVVPLRVGGGTRIKIYEAMATARRWSRPRLEPRASIFIRETISCFPTTPSISRTPLPGCYKIRRLVSGWEKLRGNWRRTMAGPSSEPSLEKSCSASCRNRSRQFPTTRKQGRI